MNGVNTPAATTEQVGAADPGQSAGRERGPTARRDHADACGIKRLGLLPGRLQVEADVRGAERPDEHTGEDEAEVGDQRLVEDARPEDRDLVEQRDREIGRGAEAGIRRPELSSLEDAGQTLAGERDRDPDDDLIEPQPHAEHDHERCADHAPQSAEDEPDRRRVQVVGADEAEVGTEQHHALEAEVEDAGTLGDRLAESGEHQRQSRQQSAHDERGEHRLAEDVQRSRR